MKKTKGANTRVNPADVPAGVIGLGLMGTSIATCLLAAGHPVAGIDRDTGKRKQAKRHILSLLTGMRKERVLKADPARIIRRFEVAEDYSALGGRQLVIESILENIDLKREVLRGVEQVVSAETLIGSNTSAIPVTRLQEGALHPERILGIHWGEPAHILRFMEIICGDQSSRAYADRAMALARHWGKEPTLVQRDIRGFITNRIMYAMLREAFYLVEAGYATPADVDRSVRNDMGWWTTLAGLFRYMDLTGIPAYAAVMRDLLPELSCQKEVPRLMQQTVDSGARGISNAKGFYSYTPAQAKRWEKIFLKFSYEIRKLGLEYPEGIGD
jgi:3-hydroxyacyl-CoA dehydrogenase